MRRMLCPAKRGPDTSSFQLSPPFLLHFSSLSGVQNVKEKKEKKNETIK